MVGLLLLLFSPTKKEEEKCYLPFCSSTNDRERIDQERKKDKVGLLCDWSRASSFRQPKCQIDESLSCVYISVKLVFNFSSQLETQLSTRPTISRAVKRKWFSIEIGGKNKTKIWERFLFYFLPTANERGKKSRRIIIIIIIRTRLLILRGVGSWWWVLLLVGWKEEKKTTMMTIRNGCHIL